MGWHSDNEKLYGDDPTIGKYLPSHHWLFQPSSACLHEVPCMKAYDCLMPIRLSLPCSPVSNLLHSLFSTASKLLPQPAQQYCCSFLHLTKPSGNTNRLHVCHALQLKAIAMLIHIGCASVTPSCAGSVSFGATRRFLLRQNSNHSNKWACELASGDVLIMKGSVQQHWTHSIPKMLRVSHPRINLTFRQIVHPER